MKRWIAVLCACAMLFDVPLAMAQSAATQFNDPVSGKTTVRVGNDADANGAISTAELYPREFQTTSEIIYGSTITASSTENVGTNPFSNASVYGIKYLRIKQTNYTTGASGLNGGCVYRIKGSMDGVAYHPIIIAQVAAGDTVKADTLQYRLYANAATPAANGLWFPLVNPFTGGPLPFKWLQVAVINRGSTTVTLELEVAGRQY